MRMEKGPLSEKEEVILSLLQQSQSPLSFSELLQKYPYSRGTFNRYLNQLIDRKVVIKVAPTGGGRKKYGINVEQTAPELFSVQYLDAIIQFYDQFGVPEDFISEIVLILSRVGEKFAALEQSMELFLSLFYLYQNLVWNSGDLRISKKEFCSQYKMNMISLEYHVNKLVTGDFGFTRVSLLNWEYFFHDTDEFGRAVRGAVDDVLQKFMFAREMAGVLRVRHRPVRSISEIPQPQGGGMQTKLDLMQATNQVLDKLVVRRYLAADLRDAFFQVIRDRIVDRAFELKLPQDLLPEDSLRKAGGEASSEKLRGFCARCGEWINWEDKTCSYCRNEIADTTLMYNCVEARQRRRQYREEVAETTIPCPHCHTPLQRNWNDETCPYCNQELPVDFAKHAPEASSNENELEEEESSAK